MVVTKRSTDWFFSNEGIKAFESTSENLAERSAFIYSYLITVIDEKDKDNSFVFKLAFLIADAIYGSDLAYSKYPAIIDPKQNPFVAYIKNLKVIPSQEIIFLSVISVLHGWADALDANEWIYDEKKQTRDCFKEKFENLNIDLISPIMANPYVFDIEPEKETLQLKIIWAFYNDIAKGD